jgi:hypothetical protein
VRVVDKGGVIKNGYLLVGLFFGVIAHPDRVTSVIAIAT